MTDNPDQPIIVDPSNTLTIIAMVARQLGLIGTGFVTLLGFVRGRDLAGFFNYVQGEDLLPLMSAVVALGIMAWGWIRSIRNKRKLVIAANAAPDSVAVVVKGEPS